MTTDIQRILNEYKSVDDDFGFSAISEEDYNARLEAEVSKVTEPVASMAEDYKVRLEQLERMIIPFLQKLHSTGDKEYIYWPNRKPAIEKQIEKILKLTRG